MKIHKSSILAFFLIFLYGGAVLAENSSTELQGFLEENLGSRMVNAKTETTAPLDIFFVEPKSAETLTGKIVPAYPLAEIHQLDLEIYDSFGTEVYSQSLPHEKLLEASFTGYDFNIQVPNSGFGETARMEVSLYHSGKKVAFGRKIIPNITAYQTQYLIHGLEILENKIIFVLENKTPQTQTFLPHITILRESDSEVVMDADVSAIAVESLSEQRIIQDFEPPNTPGVYTVSVQAFSEDKMTVFTGKLSKTLVIDGILGTIDSVSLQAIDSEKNDLEMVIAGAVFPSQKNGIIDLDLVQGQADESEVKLQKTFAINFSNDGWFTANVPLKLNKNFLLRGEIILKLENGQVLFKRKIHLWPPNFLKNVEDLTSISTSKNMGNRLASYFLPFWEIENPSTTPLFVVAGICAIVLFLFLFWFRFKKKRPKIMIWGFVLCGFFGMNALHAQSVQNWWQHPISGWSYNPLATGEFENFKKVHFQGNLINVITHQGAFLQNPDRIIVKFFRSDDPQNRVYLEIFGFSIRDHKDYEFDLELPETLVEKSKIKNAMGNLILDADGNPTWQPNWSVELFFLMPDSTVYRSLWQDQTGVSKYLKIDAVPPKLSSVISYDGETKNRVWPRVTPLQTQKSNLERIRQRNLNNKHLNNFQRQEQTNLRLSKIHQRNRLILELKDKERAQQLQNSSGRVRSRNAPQTISEDIGRFVSEINQISGEINELTAKLGTDFSPGILESENEVSATLDSVFPRFSDLPAQELAENRVNCETETGQVPVNQASTWDDCTEYYESSANETISEIEAKRTEIAVQKSQFKNSAILTSFRCEDSISGCNPVCNFESENCQIDCALNPDGCTIYEQAGGTLCQGSPKTCSVDCRIYPLACQVNHFSIDLKINTCLDSNYCDATAPRNYKVCDNVGNCTIITDSRVETDWYDPVNPQITNVSIVRNKDNLGGTETIISGKSVGNNKFSASGRLNFTINGNDPVNPTVAEYPTKFDAHACGSSNNSSFFLHSFSDTFCTQSKVACAISATMRGIMDKKQGGHCNATCPTGYLANGNFCVPQCDYRLFDGCFPFMLMGSETECTDTVWAPESNIVPLGQTFIQTGNCGTTRNAVGTAENPARYDFAQFDADYFGQ